jgi:hypothetical protein
VGKTSPGDIGLVIKNLLWEKRSSLLKSNIFLTLEAQEKKDIDMTLNVIEG